ncbi:MAG: nucleoside triphosphate pyrophosphohydrolase [Thermoleophilaceae bacterium]
MSDAAEALRRLEETTRRLRVECPWDREQDERSIVPHTVEEAYELADAARAGDDRRLLDELGDVLFQVIFLSLLVEERGAGDLAGVADHCNRKLVRRHPHVFGEVEVEDAAEVLRNWDEIKRSEPGREPGVFGEVPSNLPGPLYARKLLRRAESEGRGWPASGDALSALAGAVSSLEPGGDEGRRFAAVGDMLFAAVAAARELGVDPELALRSAAERFKEEVIAAGE